MYVFACLFLFCLFVLTRAILQGLTLQICVFHVCACVFCLSLCRDRFWRFDLRTGLHVYEKCFVVAYDKN